MHSESCWGHLLILDPVLALQLHLLTPDPVLALPLHLLTPDPVLALPLQVADLIWRRKCACPAELVTTLLVLKLKDADPPSVSKGDAPFFIAMHQAACKACIALRQVYTSVKISKV